MNRITIRVMIRCKWRLPDRNSDKHCAISGAGVSESFVKEEEKPRFSTPRKPGYLIHLGQIALAVLGIYFAGTGAAPAFPFTGLGDYLTSFYDRYDDSENLASSPPGSKAEVADSNSKMRKSIDNEARLDPAQLFDNYDVKDPEYSEFLTNFDYVLYYGGFDSRVAEAVLAVKPTLLVTNYYAIDPEIRNEFARNNISVIAYLPIHWTDRELDSTLDEARALLRDGADGLFIDEATTVTTDWEFWYHGRIYETAKQFDENALVIINPGTASIAEQSMQVADIICFEHEWRDIANLSWASDYPGWRFMGISSNEFVKVMGYHVGAGSAHDDLEEARSLNIAYHYSADHYIWLPPWLDVYGGFSFPLHPVSDYSDLDLSPVSRPSDGGTLDKPAENPPEVDREEDPPDIDAPSENDTSPEPERPVKDRVIPEKPRENQTDGGSSGANEPPKARAGKDQMIELEAEEPVVVHLDGEASDSDSSAEELSFLWTQTEGPEVNLDEEETASQSFALEPSLLTDNSETQLRFKLTVTDADGDTDSDYLDVFVTVKESSQTDEHDAHDEVEDDAHSAEGNSSEGDPETPTNETEESLQEQSNSTESNKVEVLAKDELNGNDTTISDPEHTPE